MLSTHPDVTSSLAAERIARLLAEAEDHRRAHRPQRPARPNEPPEPAGAPTLPGSLAGMPRGDRLAR